MPRSFRGTAGPGLAGQLQEARWLIKNVQQRYDTILRVAGAIVDRQRQFFDHGEVAMRRHWSCAKLRIFRTRIDRVARYDQKYMATPRGIFELAIFTR